MLHPEFSIVEGDFHVTPEWSLRLCRPFNLCVEGGSLVLWHPGLTAWVDVWRNEEGEPQRARLEWLRARAAADVFDVVEESGPGVLRFSYRLDEGADDDRVPAFYSFVVGDAGHVQLAVYFDDEVDVVAAEGLWRGLREVAA